jgi:hypothetical protein
MSAREPDRGEQDRVGGNPLSAAPGLVRIAAGAWWRTTEWSVGASMRLGSRVMRAAASGESAAELLQSAGGEARGYARRTLGLLDGDRGREDDSADLGEAPTSDQARARTRRASSESSTRMSLRDRGAELLRRSADVDYEESAHPAYERILDQLAPDEGRILRFLALEGPQPAVDVRAGRALMVGSQLVAPGLSMIGAQAGCRYLDRVPAYLNNLFRLGLIWFSREPLEDPLRYQVLEAQPDVVEAMHGSGRGKTVRRSIHLTPFGQDFCSLCLPLGTAELEALPGPAQPADGASPGR